jgi:hypothetical protein
LYSIGALSREENGLQKLKVKRWRQNPSNGEEWAFIIEDKVLRKLYSCGRSRKLLFLKTIFWVS